MPIYEYKCNACGNTSEILHKSTTIKEVVCPDCRSDNMEKLISAPGAVMTKGPAPQMPAACPKSQQCGQSSCPAAQLRR